MRLFPLIFIYFSYFHEVRLQARALAKSVLFKDGDSGFPFILPGRSYFILFNLSWELFLLMFHGPLLSFYPTKMSRSHKKNRISLKTIIFFFLIFVSDEEINNSSSKDLTVRDGAPVNSVKYVYACAVSNWSMNSSPSPSYIFHKNRHNSNYVHSVLYANSSLSNASSEHISPTLSSFRLYSFIFVPIHC